MWIRCRGVWAAIAIRCQNGYPHLLIEHRVLQLGGERIRKQIIVLGCTGDKIEPAFATLLGIVGDPHENLRLMESGPDKAIIAVLG